MSIETTWIKSCWHEMTLNEVDEHPEHEPSRTLSSDIVLVDDGMGLLLMSALPLYNISIPEKWPPSTTLQPHRDQKVFTRKASETKPHD